MADLIQLAKNFKFILWAACLQLKDWSSWEAESDIYLRWMTQPIKFKMCYKCANQKQGWIERHGPSSTSSAFVQVTYTPFYHLRDARLWQRQCWKFIIIRSLILIKDFFLWLLWKKKSFSNSMASLRTIISMMKFFTYKCTRCHFFLAEMNIKLYMSLKVKLLFSKAMESFCQELISCSHVSLQCKVTPPIF